MNFNLPITEAQPEFPLVDLTKENTNALALTLANAAMVTAFHSSGESSAFAYRVGHPAVMRSSAQLYEGSRIDALEHGIMVFEAINAVVAATEADKLSPYIVQKTALWLDVQASDTELRKNSIDAIDTFKTELPNTTEVVAEASHRFFGALTEYAILGAALERDIVVSAQSFDG